MNDFMKANNFMWQVLIKGISLEDEDQDSSTYTVEQMAELRFVLMTEASLAIFNDAESLVLGDQYGTSFLMFGTEFSYQVVDSLVTMKKIVAGQEPAEKLQHLLGYTFFLNTYDVWMYDNEGDMGKFTKSLALFWKNLLKNSDEELGWDETYTKPGALELLARFKKRCENEELPVSMPFKYN
jgi:hypothetical protein